MRSPRVSGEFHGLGGQAVPHGQTAAESEAIEMGERGVGHGVPVECVDDGASPVRDAAGRESTGGQGSRLTAARHPVGQGRCETLQPQEVRARLGGGETEMLALEVGEWRIRGGRRVSQVGELLMAHYI